MTREESVTKFLTLEPTFGSTALSDVYCPWLSVDFFGKAKIFEGLDPTKSCQRDVQSSSKSRRVESIEPPTTIYFPRGKSVLVRVFQVAVAHPLVRPSMPVPVQVNPNCT